MEKHDENIEINEELNAIEQQINEEQQTKYQEQKAEVIEQERNSAQMWAMIPAMIGGTLAMVKPEMKEIYTQENCMTWGEAMVPVAKKYGWDITNGFPPEIGLLLATVPFALPTYLAFKKDDKKTKVEDNDQEEVKDEEQSKE